MWRLLARSIPTFRSRFRLRMQRRSRCRLIPIGIGGAALRPPNCSGNARIRFALTKGKTSTPGAHMPKYVIERDIPNAGKMSPQELQAISQTSCGVLQKLGPQIQWLESFVTDDKIYC